MRLHFIMIFLVFSTISIYILSGQFPNHKTLHITFYNITFMCRDIRSIVEMCGNSLNTSVAELASAPSPSPNVINISLIPIAHTSSKIICITMCIIPFQCPSRWVLIPKWPHSTCFFILKMRGHTRL